MLETYTIDPALMGNIKKRMLKILAIVSLFVLTVAFLPELLGENKLDVKTIGLTVVIVLAMLTFSMNRVLNKYVNSFKTLKIVLDDSGIERKADLQPHKRILWDNLKVEEKAKGGILLSDQTISKFNRKMYGRGAIYIHPETLDKDKLVNSIRLKAPYAF